MRLFDFLNRTYMEGEGIGTGGGGAPPAPPAAPPPVERPWYDGADAETVGYLQNRQWDTLPPKEAAFKAIQAHREAERFIGVPSNKLLRLADPTNSEEYKAMWQRLGAADTPDKYDLSGIKNAKDEPLAPAAVAALQKAFAENYVPVSAAQGIAKALTALNDARTQETVQQQQQRLASNKEELAKSWGQNANANMFIAQQAAQKLGVTPEMVAALEAQAGYTGVMNMFLKLGQEMGEAKFVNGGPNGEARVNTVEQAKAEIEALKSDSAWVKKYLDGDQAAVSRMTYLTKIMVGEDGSTYRAA